MQKSSFRIILFAGLFSIFIAGAIFASNGYISARTFAETNGIAYQWFPIQKMLVMRKGLKSAKLKVNDTKAIVDGKIYPLPLSPKISDGQIMVPAEAITRIFQGKPPLGATANPTPPKTAPVSAQPQTQKFVKIATSPASQLNSPPPANISTEKEKAILVALRHSKREDHTRVVLEFNGNIKYSGSISKNTYRLAITGCKNLIPTRRTNPVGRDIKKINFNSGPNRSGLILNFTLPPKAKKPVIETVDNPFRMIISFFDSGHKPPVAENSATQPKIAKPIVKEIPKIEMEKAPEISIQVPVASISNSSFLGRTVVIDAAHGGTDPGTVVAGRPPEKEIVLIIAQHLKTALENMGMKAVLIRTADNELSAKQRVSIANRHGGDLHISLHTGGSTDKSKSGIACYIFGSTGLVATSNKTPGLSHETIFSEWLKTTRFDLATFLAQKIEARMKKHLKVDSRGIKSLPLLPLKYIVNPAVLIEVGMLTDSVEGKNLLSDNYKKAIAQSIANSVADFFNGIVIKQ
jgi:N-acetylmuramoyl-L-alanine amidase